MICAPFSGWPTWASHPVFESRSSSRVLSSMRNLRALAEPPNDQVHRRGTTYWMTDEHSAAPAPAQPLARRRPPGYPWVTVPLQEITILTAAPAGQQHGDCGRLQWRWRWYARNAVRSPFPCRRPPNTSDELRAPSARRSASTRQRAQVIRHARPPRGAVSFNRVLDGRLRPSRGRRRAGGPRPRVRPGSPPRRRRAACRGWGCAAGRAHTA